MIKTNTARKIANSWHGGQWSALYQFASSGEFVEGNSIDYLWEIMRDLQNEFFAPYPQILPKTDITNLNKLKEYFETQILANTGKVVQYAKHPIYGYLYPSIEGFEISLPI